MSVLKFSDTHCSVIDRALFFRQHTSNLHIMRVIPHITVGQAATVINACIAVVHQTSGLALVVLLIYVLRQ